MILFARTHTPAFYWPTENLVMTGFVGARSGILAGKIKRRANLAGFQDIADAVLKARRDTGCG